MTSLRALLPRLPRRVPPPGQQVTDELRQARCPSVVCRALGTHDASDPRCNKYERNET